MGRDPGDVATRADTLGIIIGECIRRADSLEWQDSRKRSGSTRRATRHALNPIEAFRCEEVADWRGGGAPARRAQ